MSRETVTDPDGAAATRAGRLLGGRLGGLAAAIVLGLGASGALVWHGTDAAFTSNASNPANSWNSANVNLTNNSPSGAVFTVAALIPGNIYTRCLTVSFTGNVASQIKLYTTSTSGSTALADDLDLQIQSATAPDATGPASCAAYSWGTTWTGTLKDLTAFNSWANPAPVAPSTWTTGATTEYRAYKITYTFRPTSALAGSTTATTLTWEARNT